jgi:transcriptional regulator with XRE-family HTH domain
MVAKRPGSIDLSVAVNVAFGAKLRRVRRLRDVSQGELASRVGLSRVTVATIEGGKQNTQLQHVFLFARALDVSIEELVPTLQEVKQHQKMDNGTGAVATSDLLFLQDARALLLQMKKGSYEQQAADETAD